MIPPQEKQSLINCDFSGNVLDEVDQAQVYIRDAIIALAKEIRYCIDSLTNRNLWRDFLNFPYFSRLSAS